MNSKMLMVNVLLGVVIGICVITGCTKIRVEGIAIDNKKDSSIDDELLMYNNTDYSFNARYSINWQYQEGDMGTIVIFLSPQESENDTFRENINIYIEDLSGLELTLAEYNQFSIEQLKKVITNINIITKQEYNELPDEAYEIVFTGKQGVFLLKWKQIYFIKDEKAYVITYTAEEDRYYDYLPYYEQFMKDLEY